MLLTSVAFESDLKLQRIEKSAFPQSGLTSIHIPASVEVLCERCFSDCESLTSVTFELHSKLREVGVNSFVRSPHLHLIKYPPSFHGRRALGPAPLIGPWE
jgi:hypothetical protein